MSSRCSHRPPFWRRRMWLRAARAATCFSLLIVNCFLCAVGNIEGFCRIRWRWDVYECLLYVVRSWRWTVLQESLGLRLCTHLGCYTKAHMDQGWKRVCIHAANATNEPD